MKKTAIYIVYLGLLPLLLSACTTLLRPNYTQILTELRSGEYQLDPDHSSLLFKVGHLGLSTYVGRFNQFQGELDFDPQAITTASLQAVVKTGSIDVNNTEFEKELTGADWLHAERWPEAVFTTTAAKRAEGNRVVFSGQLELRGVRQPVDIDVWFKGGATNLLTGRYTIGFEANAIIQREAFGIDKYPGIVGDTVELEIHAEFQRIKD